jgi:hypothetical protein
VSRDIKQRKGNTGTDKLNSLSKLVNAYYRLVERTKNDFRNDLRPTEANYYEKMEKECIGEGVGN